MVQQALNGIIKAVQARLCGACRDGVGVIGVQMKGVGSGPGLQTDS